jgi:hypothetical protein
MNVEEEIQNELAREITNHIDFELLTDVLVACGWHVVKLSSLLNRKRSIDIMDWCHSDCKGKWKHNGRAFVFQEQGDAVNFALRWS